MNLRLQGIAVFLRHSVDEILLLQRIFLDSAQSYFSPAVAHRIKGFDKRA